MIIINWLARHIVATLISILTAATLTWAAYDWTRIAKFIWYDGHGATILIAMILSTALTGIVYKLDNLFKRAATIQPAPKTKEQRELETAKLIRLIKHNRTVINGPGQKYLKMKLDEQRIQLDTAEYQQYQTTLEQYLADKDQTQFNAATTRQLQRLER